jgi:hypothetical protein
MTSNTLGSKGRNSAEWKKAWDAISRLAAARQLALREMKDDVQPNSITAHNGSIDLTERRAPPTLAPTDTSEYARAIAEIEQACAMLRRTEPDLETWRRDAVLPAGEVRKSRSVWLLVGGIWLSTVVVFAGAIGAILYLLG